MDTASSALESGTARGPLLAEFTVMTGMVRLPRRVKCLVSCRVSRLVSATFSSFGRERTVWCLVSGHRSCLVSGLGSSQLSGVWSWASQRCLVDRARTSTAKSRTGRPGGLPHPLVPCRDDRAVKASPPGGLRPALTALPHRHPVQERWLGSCRYRSSPSASLTAAKFRDPGREPMQFAPDALPSFRFV